jgi:hypothetical protein
MAYTVQAEQSEHHSAVSKIYEDPEEAIALALQWESEGRERSKLQFSRVRQSPPELARPKGVKSMRNQDCDAYHDQNTCDVRHANVPANDTVSANALKLRRFSSSASKRLVLSTKESPKAVSIGCAMLSGQAKPNVVSAFGDRP